MATSRQDKEQQLEQLTQSLTDAKGIAFAEYRGLKVKEIDQIRKNLKKENVKYSVVKVTLLKKAMESLGIKSDDFKYTGPVAIVTSEEDETAPARAIKGLGKEYKSLVLGGGILDKAVIDQKMAISLADLPSKQQLLGQLVSVIAGPARGLVTVLSGNMRQLVYALNAIADAKK